MNKRLFKAQCPNCDLSIDAKITAKPGVYIGDMEWFTGNCPKCRRDLIYKEVLKED